MQRPKIICLCGSTRFYEAFLAEQLRLTLEGHVVLSIGCAQRTDEEHGITPDQKAALDRLHLWKVWMSDEVIVLNVDGYVGSSTASEVMYALWLRTPVTYLEPNHVSIRPLQVVGMPNVSRRNQSRFANMLMEFLSKWKKECYPLGLEDMLGEDQYDLTTT